MTLDKSPTYPSEEIPGDAVPSQFPSPYPGTPESLAHGLQHCAALTAQRSEGFRGPPHSSKCKILSADTSKDYSRLVIWCRFCLNRAATQK